MIIFIINLIKEFLKSIFAPLVPKPKIEAPLAPVISLTPWMEVAKKEIGEKEILGNQDNPRIIEYLKSTDINDVDLHDEIPWCSAFVTWCLTQAGYKSTQSAWARSYLNYGTHIDKPQYGCIVIYQRGADSGHVHFFDHEDDVYIYGLGGNQNNAVDIGKYEKSRVLGFRMPIK